MRRLAAAIGVVALAVVSWAAPVAAHAELTDTRPVSGAQLEEAPNQVVLRFTEPVQTSVGGIRVFDADAQRLDRGSPYHPDGRGEEVALDLDGLSDGAYVVTWRVVSADSHPIEGAFTFRVGDADGQETAALAERLLAAEGNDALVGGSHAAARVLLFGSLLLLVGGVAFVLGLWPGGAGDPTAQAVLGAAFAGAVVATTVGIGLQGAYAAGLGLSAAVDPDVLAEVVDTRFGRAALARLALLAVAGGVLAAVVRVGGTRRPPAWQVASLAVAGAGLLATVSVSGHAATGEWVALALPADVVHLAAAATWLGGLAVLAVAVLRRGDPRELSDVVPRFSRVAFASVVVILVTGAFQSWRQLGGVDAVTDTTYGRLLTVKVAIFAAMVVLAAVSRSWVRRRYRPADGAPVDPGATTAVDVAPLRRSVAAEALAAIAVVTVTALLVNAVPGHTALALPHTLRLEAGDDLLLDVTVDPATAGPLDLHLYTLTTAGLPAEAEEVSARLDLAEEDIGPLDVPLSRAGPNHFVAYGFEVPIAGEWRLGVTVRTSDVDQETTTATIPIR